MLLYSKVVDTQCSRSINGIVSHWWFFNIGEEESAWELNDSRVTIHSNGIPDGKNSVSINYS